MCNYLIIVNVLLIIYQKCVCRDAHVNDAKIDLLLGHLPVCIYHVLIMTIYIVLIQEINLA